MLAYFLAIAVALVSLTLYLTAFFRPQIHRQDDFLWSGLGLFSALTLWICAGRITGAVLLGQLALVTITIAFIWENRQLRQAITTSTNSNQALEGFSILSLIASLFTKLTNLTKPKSVKPKPQKVSTPVKPVSKDISLTTEKTDHDSPTIDININELNQEENNQDLAKIAEIIEEEKKEKIKEVSKVIEEVKTEANEVLEELYNVIDEKIESESIELKQKIEENLPEVKIKQKSPINVPEVDEILADNYQENNQILATESVSKKGFFGKIVQVIKKPFQKKNQSLNQVNNSETISNELFEEIAVTEVENAIANLNPVDTQEKEVTLTENVETEYIETNQEPKNLFKENEEIAEELIDQKEEYLTELIVDEPQLFINTDEIIIITEEITDDLEKELNIETNDQNEDFNLDLDINVQSEDVSDEDTINSLTDLIETDSNGEDLTDELDKLFTESDQVFKEEEKSDMNIDWDEFENKN